ncbi:type II toxin-antitoxin system PemK/MazF family toxin [Patescibacteria group bacterium]|nr:type II toxin-antitoxin system PemK/MazF family toxin [Patescibacteria group bacterium]
MEKDFDEWNKLKKKTNDENPRYYKVQEIWWCRFGINIGTEQDGRGDNFLRPALILCGFGHGACLVVPLTTSTREHPLRVSVGVVNGRAARANISQMRVIDTRRLVEKIGLLQRETFAHIRKSIRDLF